MLGDPLPPKQPAKVLRAKQLRTIQTVLAVFFGLSVLGWWCHRAMEARRWLPSRPVRSKAERRKSGAGPCLRRAVLLRLELNNFFKAFFKQGLPSYLGPYVCRTITYIIKWPRQGCCF